MFAETKRNMKQVLITLTACAMLFSCTKKPQNQTPEQILSFIDSMHTNKAYSALTTFQNGRRIDTFYFNDDKTLTEIYKGHTYNYIVNMTDEWIGNNKMIKITCPYNIGFYSDSVHLAPPLFKVICDTATIYSVFTRGSNGTTIVISGKPNLYPLTSI